MNQTREEKESQKTKIAAQFAELSVLLGMIPSDNAIKFHAPLTEKTMALSEWLRAMRGSFLELSILISRELDIQLQ